ncbi:flavonol synthase flavanone 3-hydroxylase [Moniliophthora roreri MCA 2997]|uniref:Flavonol synthase flavanone 3-hydroxylase n=1 Tax=Moniliophthora roreri (strain MCA 2997) TaxID=1381753 RepID=V2Y9X7_MONRO|nr:flavonol synthase flavanone 3-hydroxylase [Moniliophthora roreri MCA 2997]
MPGILSSSAGPIPIIDFAHFGDGTSEEARAIGQKFFEACRDVGFAYVINTGIPQEKVDGMFEWSAKFFALPLETKQKAPHPPEGWKHRGYSGVGVEQVSQMVFDSDELASIRTGKFPDFKESFEAGNDSPSARLENVWLPEEDLPGFREYAMDYYWTCRKFQIEKLLPALAVGMGLQKSFFDDYHKDADNQLRLLHYPEAPARVFESGEKGRIGAHTDFGTCTILFQDDVGGLEVESPKEPGVFIPVPPMRGAAVFNIGDFLMRWSNDTLKSTLHRVRAPPRKDGDSDMVRARFSIPYFIGADRDTVVDCLPSCWGPDKPKKYEPITAKDYIDMRLNATYV